jgi:RNA polymerase sigma factor (sigma-70 family)
MANAVIEELLSAYAELRRWLVRTIRNPVDADDLAQASFERVWTHAAHFDIGSPRALLFHTSRNLRIDATRRAALASWEPFPVDTDGRAAHEALTVQPTPERQAISRDLLDRIAAAIEALPPRCREAFVLNRIHGLSHNEVAHELGISRSAVEKHVMRGLHTCREILKE